MNIVQNPSPNFSKRSKPAIGYIIHGTLGKFDGAVEWLCTPPEERPVISYSSAHYVIAKDGRITQLVSENDIAWHAGNVSNPTKKAQAVLTLLNGKYSNPNEIFIGIELEWFLGDKVTEEQYACVVDVIKKSGIKNPSLFCHKEIADYKVDFQTPTGTIDSSIVDELYRRLDTQNITKKADIDNINVLFTRLSTQMITKDYKGAKDTCSYLFNGLTKII